jgi:hypothetical protein
MLLVLEAISPFRLIDTDKIYKYVLHISSLYIRKHFLFLATIAIYKTKLTAYTLRSFFTFDTKAGHKRMYYNYIFIFSYKFCFY